MAKSPLPKSVSAKSASPKPVKHTPTRKNRKPRATFVEKSVSKRYSLDEDEFPETHLVTGGIYEGFMCTPVKGTANKVILHKNARGTPLKRKSEAEVSEKNLQDLDHQDMMLQITENHGGDGKEDEALVEYEETLWQCPKCSKMNRNDASECGTIEKYCGGRKFNVPMINSWVGCFASMNIQVRACE